MDTNFNAVHMFLKGCLALYSSVVSGKYASFFYFNVSHPLRGVEQASKKVSIENGI